MGGLDGGAEARVDAKAEVKAKQEAEKKDPAPVEGAADVESDSDEREAVRERERQREVEETSNVAEDREVEELAAAAEAEGGADPAQDKGTDTDAPVEEKDFLTKLSDAWSEIVDAFDRGDWGAMLTAIVGLFSSGEGKAAVEAQVKQDEKVRDLSVEGYKKVLKDLGFPENVTVDPNEVGYMLADKKYDTPEKLKTFLTGKKVPAGWTGGGLSDLLEALNKPAEDDEKPAEQKPVTYSPPEGFDTSKTHGICKITLATGETIGVDRSSIRVGGKKYKIEAKKGGWFDLQIEKIIPTSNGGCQLFMSTVLDIPFVGRVSKSPILDVEKIASLVKSLNQKSASADQIEHTVGEDTLRLIAFS